MPRKENEPVVHLAKIRLPILLGIAAAWACSDSSGPSDELPRFNIVYLRDVYHNGIETRLEVLDLPSKTSRGILGTPLVGYYYPRASPIGPSVTLTRNDQAFPYCDSVFRVSIATGHQAAVGVLGADPSWGPTGATLAYAVITGSGTAVVVSDTNGLNPDTLAFGERPVWSPDASQLAIFYKPDNIDDEIGVINSASPTSRTNLSNSILLDALPAWSPDGSTIAFYSRRAAGAGVYLMQSDGSNQRFLYAAALVLPPAWSPDGKLLAVLDASGPNNEGLLQVISSSGTLRNTLPFSPGAVTSFAWSQDGGHLLVIARDSATSYHNRLFVVARGSSEAIALLPDSVDVPEAQWLVTN